MHDMIKRHTLHLDDQDMKALARIAREETKATGIRVTAAGLVRRLIKEHLRERTHGALISSARTKTR